MQQNVIEGAEKHSLQYFCPKNSERIPKRIPTELYMNSVRILEDFGAEDGRILLTILKQSEFRQNSRKLGIHTTNIFLGVF